MSSLHGNPFDAVVEYYDENGGTCEKTVTVSWHLSRTTDTVRVDVGDIKYHFGVLSAQAVFKALKDMMEKEW